MVHPVLLADQRFIHCIEPIDIRLFPSQSFRRASGKRFGDTIVSGFQSTGGVSFLPVVKYL
jgi:hypothetical protein